MNDITRKDARRQQFIRKKKYKNIKTSSEVKQIRKDLAATEDYLNGLQSDDGEKQ